MEFSLSEIISLLIRRLKFITICVLLGLLICFINYYYLTNPTYMTHLQMYVNPNETPTSADINELYYAQKVVTTYINFLQTKRFYQMVAADCGLKYTSDQLKNMTTIEDVDGTEIFQITITGNDPKDCFIIAQSIQKVVPELIKSIKNTAVISVVDPAVLPAYPSGPNIMLMTVLGGFVGLLLSVLGIFLWEILDVNVKSQEDLRKKYDIPILGAIPDFKMYRKYRLRIIHSIPILKKYLRTRASKNNINKGISFLVNESYNTLRTSLRFTLRKDVCKKIIISSPSPQDGKSTTSANLAVTLAHSGAKVMLIDCDLRKGSIHQILKLKGSPGLSEALSGMINEKDAIQTTSYENLEVITMGAIPPNPNDLLGSIQMEELIKKIEKLYDYIIIDTSPVNIVSDALSLVKLSDGVIIVVREGVTSHHNIENSISKYNLSQANIIGFVLNGVSMKQSRSMKTKYY